MSGGHSRPLLTCRANQLFPAFSHSAPGPPNARSSPLLLPMLRCHIGHFVPPPPSLPHTPPPCLLLLMCTLSPLAHTRPKLYHLPLPTATRFLSCCFNTTELPARQKNRVGGQEGIVSSSSSLIECACKNNTGVGRCLAAQAVAIGCCGGGRCSCCCSIAAPAAAVRPPHCCAWPSFAAAGAAPTTNWCGLMATLLVALSVL